MKNFTEELKKKFLDPAVKSDSKDNLEVISQILSHFLGITPYKEQVMAAKKMYQGNICDMKTGEGKTISILMCALMFYQSKRKVYVVTANDYLSKRDLEYAKSIYSYLGIKAVHFRESVGGQTSAYERADIIYATGETLIFDYLRGIKAEYDTAIIDEIDYILVENANHDFSVSNNDAMIRMPEGTYRLCQKLADMMTYQEVTSATKEEDRLFDLQYEADTLVDRRSRQVEITTRGQEFLEKLFHNEASNLVFLEALHSALLVKHFYLKDVHYVVKDDKIIIINDSSGRISIGGSNDISIQTAIEMKEGVTITPKALYHSTCSYPVFFSIFREIVGISGTTSYVPYDFSMIYGKNVVKIPEHRPNKRKEISKFFPTDEKRLDFIKTLVSIPGTPYLIVTDSDQRSKQIYDHLQSAGSIHCYLLDNEALPKEEELLSEFAKNGAVLISSKIVGRGTDIQIPWQFEEGLTVILSIRLPSERAERQVIGRCARNGQPGTAYLLTCPTDSIYSFSRTTTRREKDVKHLQALYEAKAFEQRKHIYIRSKMFFDQDQAIMKRLQEFNSYEEILDFLKKQDPSSDATVEKAIELCEAVIERKSRYLDPQRAILLKAYQKLRPIFQQQFLRYNDLMARTLYEPNGLHDRSMEHIKAGRDIIVDCIFTLLSCIVPPRKKGAE